MFLCVIYISFEIITFTLNNKKETKITFVASNYEFFNKIKPNEINIEKLTNYKNIVPLNYTKSTDKRNIEKENHYNSYIIELIKKYIK